jgi:hypothetical protein
MGGIRNAYKMLIRKPEGKGPLGRPRCSWENNIRMDLREGNKVGSCGTDSTGLGRHQWGGCCENGNEPPGSVKCEIFLD